MPAWSGPGRCLQGSAAAPIALQEALSTCLTALAPPCHRSTSARCQACWASAQPCRASPRRPKKSMTAWRGVRARLGPAGRLAAQWGASSVLMCRQRLLWLAGRRRHEATAQLRRQAVQQPPVACAAAGMAHGGSEPLSRYFSTPQPMVKGEVSERRRGPLPGRAQKGWPCDGSQVVSVGGQLLCTPGCPCA